VIYRGDVSVDYRTRTDADLPAVEPARFFEVDLPELVEGHPDLVEVARHLRLPPLAIAVDGGESWVLERNGTITAHPGTAETTFAVTADRLADLVNDQVTPVGLMTAGEWELDHSTRTVMDWWLVLRSLIDERPIHVPGAIDVDVDVNRSFTLDDDPAELRTFLEAAGYLHVRGVFTPDEMATISHDMDVAEPDYSPGDGKSWWASLADGRERVVRMQWFEQCSETTAAIITDDRFLRLGEIPGCGHEAGREGRHRVEALFKPIGVAKGISDVPWHKDCSIGRHSYECCSITVGISVTGAGPGSGQLRVIAGSHRALVWPSLFDAGRLDLPEVPLATETGDVTVHLSCTLHMAEPPTVRERRVLYTGFGLPAPDAEAAVANRRRLQAARESAPLNASQPPA
jgi:hypothetical protein